MGIQRESCIYVCFQSQAPVEQECKIKELVTDESKHKKPNHFSVLFIKRVPFSEHLL